LVNMLTHEKVEGLKRSNGSLSLTLQLFNP
jgi:hypothetical protein